jgi:hypothetical protein
MCPLTILFLKHLFVPSTDTAMLNPKKDLVVCIKLYYLCLTVLDYLTTVRRESKWPAKKEYND